MPVRNRQGLLALEVTLPLAFLVILRFERASFPEAGPWRAGRLRLTEAEVVVAPYRLTVRHRAVRPVLVVASAGPGGIRSNYCLRLERGPPAGGAALQDELFEKPVRLFHLTVAQFGPHPPAGHIKVDTGQVERSLNGPWTRRTLWTFSSGTHVVTLRNRPVVAAATEPSDPEARKW